MRRYPPDPSLPAGKYERRHYCRMQHISAKSKCFENPTEKRAFFDFITFLYRNQGLIRHDHVKVPPRNKSGIKKRRSFFQNPEMKQGNFRDEGGNRGIKSGFLDSSPEKRRTGAGLAFR
jgi:hypothetical protein